MNYQLCIVHVYRYEWVYICMYEWAYILSVCIHIYICAAGTCCVMTIPPRAAFTSEICLRSGDVAQWHWSCLARAKP